MTLKYCLLFKVLFLPAIYVSVGCCSLSQAGIGTENKIDSSKIALIFQTAGSQLEQTWETVEQTGKLPRSTQRGFKPIEDWTSGFYPGILWFIYEYTKDDNIKQKAAYATALLEKEQYNTRDHDIGFRIYCSYGNGYRLTQLPDYKNAVIQAAKSAVQRYDPKVKVIMSWEPNKERDWQYPVIIDNMMNLELLFAATEFTGDSSYYTIAVNHALTTMKNQYREDYSCSHVVDYDPLTGKKRKMDWNNGSDNPETAAWSRGQSWGLYGYTMMFRETRDKQFLDHAEKIAGFILNHPNMPADMIPYWDFHAPDLPAVRDASAAAIMASALIELSGYSPKKGNMYFNAGEKILQSLSSENYLAQPGTNKGFLIKHTTGNFLRNSEVDGSLIYADYYFLEALLRYTAVKQKLAAIQH